MTNSVLKLPKVCMNVLMSLSGFDSFLGFLFLANLSTFVVPAQSILKQMWLALRAPLSGIQYD